jgi:RNA polymerase sigma-70 factor (ECF subfamily)
VFADEKRLIEACIQGEDKAYRELYRRHGQRVYQLAFRYFNNPDDAADITQETFMRIYRSIATYRSEAKLSTWIHRIAVNLCLDELRRRKRNNEMSMDAHLLTEEGEMELQLKDPSPGPHQQTESLHRMEALKKHLASLPDEQKTAVILRDINNLSYQEIAKILECNLGTVKSRINRGRIALRELLLKEGELFPLGASHNSRRGEGK